MGNSDVNAARLLLTVRDLPSWKNDMPRLVTGLLGRQQKGAWWTTTANAWGTVAVRRFGLVFENTIIRCTSFGYICFVRLPAKVKQSPRTHRQHLIAHSPE